MLLKRLSLSCATLMLGLASATSISASSWAMQTPPSQQKAQKQERPVFVLIHGAWGSGDGWYKVRSLMQQAGYKVLTPTLPGQGQRLGTPPSEISLDTHIDDIVKTLEKAKISRAILVGHSYGGMVITGVADRLPERVNHVVYVDAFLPENNESAFDLMHPTFVQVLRKQAASRGDGGIASGSGKGPPQPLLTLDQKLTLRSDPACTINGTYILTVEPGLKDDAFMPAARRAKNRNWPVFVIETGHLPQLTEANALSALLVKTALASEDDTSCSPTER